MEFTSKRLSIKAQYDVDHDAISLFMWRQSEGGKERALITWEKVEPGESINAIASVSTESVEPLQLLMDSLWSSGVRPKFSVDAPGALSATKDHLADMRRLVFEGMQLVDTRGRNA